MFLMLFINVALTLIGYGTPLKLDYCFNASTSLVPVAVSTLRNGTEAANNSALTFLEHTHIIDHTFRLHKCACANMKVGVAAKLRREKFSFSYMANERRFEYSNLFPSFIVKV